MKTFIRSSYFIFLFNILINTLASAQAPNYPIDGTATVSLPASATLEDYLNPIVNPINVEVILKDLKIPTRSVYLQVEMNGPGLVAQSLPTSASTSFEISSGVLFRIPKTIIAACFSPDNLQGVPQSVYQQPLPSGIYTFTFYLRDVFSGALLSKPIQTAPTWIEVSDPPLPTYPLNYSGVTVNQVQNVVFQWLPRHTPNNNIEYEFTLTELPIANRGNLQNVFLSQPPLCKITTTQPSLLYDAKYPPLRQGAVYAWRVQVKPKFGAIGKASNFLNDGYSEIFSFFYEKPTEQLNPPTDLNVVRSPDYNKIYFDWKGESNHQKYVVTSLRFDKNNEEGAKKDPLTFDTFEVEKGMDGVTKYTKFTGRDDSPSSGINTHSIYNKSEFRVLVRAVDVFGRMSEPAIYDMEAIEYTQFDEQQRKPLSLNGNVEAVIRAYDPLKLEPNKVTITGEKSRYKVKDALVCLYGLTKESTAKNIQEFKNRWLTNSSYTYDNRVERLDCRKTSSDGKYSLSSNRIDIITLNSYKYKYLTIEGPTIDYGGFITTIEIQDEGGASERTLGTQTLLTNTIRLNPIFKLPDGRPINNEVFEEINVYRLKTVYEANKELLQYEAGQNVSKEIRYNKNQYVKVGDIQKPNLNLFTNETTLDNFVIGAKEYGKDEKHFPMNKINGYTSVRIGTKDGHGIPTINANFVYTPPLLKIKGKVAARGKSGGQSIPAPNWEVGILVLKNSKDIRDIDAKGKVTPPNEYEKFHWEEVTTDEAGNYEFTLPEEITFNQEIDDIIIYNRISGVYSFYQGKRIDKPAANIVVDIDLQSTGTAIASIVKDQHGEPIVGAKLTHSSGAMATSNQNGEFILNVQFSPSVEADQSVKLLADGYLTDDIDLSTFSKSTSTEEVSDFGRSFWNTQIQQLRSLTRQNFEELGNEDAFESNFEDYNTRLQAFYKQDSVGATSIDHVVLIRTYVLDDKNEKQYTASSLVFDKKNVDIPETGIVKLLHTKGTTLEGKITNKDKTAEVLYLEKEFSVDFDTPTNKTDTVKVEVELTKAILVAGVVTAFREDSSKIGVEAGVTIAAEDIDEVETDAEGRFEIWLEKDAEEVEITLTKKGFNTITWAFTTKTKTKEEKIRNFVNNASDDFEYTTVEALKELQLSIYRRDATIPDFKTLQGFAIDVASIKRIDADTYLMTGSIDLSEEESIYELDEGEELTFEEVEVEVDDYDEENAVLVDDDTDLLQETLNLKLFNYAKVESNNENEGNTNFIKLIKLKLEGRESLGKIGGVGLKFKPEKILKKTSNPIFQEFDLVPNVAEKQGDVAFNNDITDKNKQKLLDANAKQEAKKKEGKYDVVAEGAEKEEKPELKKYQEKEKDAPIIPVFVSGGKKLANFNEELEFKLEFPGDVEGVERRDEKDDDGNPTGKKEKISLGLGLGFSILLDEEKEASLTKDGVVFAGDLAFPMMKKIGIEGYMPIVEKLLLAPKGDLPMREIRFAKREPEDGKGTPYYVRLGVAGSWRFEIDKIQVFDDFSNAGFGGKLYTDKKNHLIVHSMAVRKANGSTYPFLDMEFPEEGFKIKNLILKSPEDQHILLGYNFDDEAYEVEAGVRMEVTKNTNKMIKDLFPLEVEKLVYNTAGKFYVAVKVGRTVNAGPVKVNIRKVLFNKGGAVPWSEMLQTLQRSNEETAELNKTTKYNNAYYRTLNEKRVLNRDSNVGGYEVMQEEDDIELQEGEVDWAFGIAGGAQVESLKGIKAKADASFVVGELDGQFTIQFNNIDIVMESTAFKAFMSLNLSTSGDRVGFEGKGEMDTMKRRWGASLKLYKLPDGIEFGASIVASTYGLVSGPLMWTSVGGGIDINTATNKYSVFFLGSATTTGTSPEVSELRAIRLEVLFETDACGAMPVVKGSADWYLKKNKYCTATVLLDFCRTIILANIDCVKEIIEGSEANIQGTIYLTSESVFIGANVKTVVLGMNANAVFALGINNNFFGASVPRDVAKFKDYINSNYLVNGKTTLNGIYLDATLGLYKEWSGEYKVFAWSIKTAISNRTYLFFSFSELAFRIGNDFNFELGAYGRVGVKGFCLEAWGELKLRLLIEGGRDNTEGWNFRGSAAVTASLGNNKSLGCDDYDVEWCKVVIPCGIDWKICLNKSLEVRYQEKGADAGWDFGL
ncbi:hypothetical protein [Runella sp. SP2]|uniref:hypothetical protein n=1 Tax=Runella sp. SP2 TaxID=2268026 RepID=UPI000F0813D7|nr:hypothetical protein [Runella sp. SP2]AYQ36625.1 hypothetical protein DTQ70_30345 [Runella sp. SP2]